MMRSLDIPYMDLAGPDCKLICNLFVEPACFSIFKCKEICDYLSDAVHYSERKLIAPPPLCFIHLFLFSHRNGILDQISETAM